MPYKPTPSPFAVSELPSYVDRELHRIAPFTGKVGILEELAVGDVRRWGAIDGSTDDATTAFESALSEVGDDGTLVARGTYRISQLPLLSNRNLDLRGAVIESANPNTYMFQAADVDNIEIVGGVIDGRRSAGSGAGTFEYGFWFRGATNVRMRGTRIKDCYKDAMELGKGAAAGDPCEDFLIDGIICENSGRNNISVTHCDGFAGWAVCRGAQDASAHYSGPWAGIDFEPDNGEYVDNVDLKIYTEDNDGGGVVIYGLAGAVTHKSRINMEHYSAGDVRGLRVGRWLNRAAGNELVINYKGEIHTPLSTDSGLYVDDIGSGSFLNIDVRVYQTDNTKDLLTFRRDTATSASITGTPTIRMSVVGIGAVDRLFSNDTHNSADMSQDCEISIDVGALTASSVGLQGSTADVNFCGRLTLTPADADHFTLDKTSNFSLGGNDNHGGALIVTNAGASGDITGTLTNGSFGTGAEVEFHITDDSGGITVTLSLTTANILPRGGDTIGCWDLGGRIRLKKLSNGDWAKIPSPRGDAGEWISVESYPFRSGAGSPSGSVTPRYVGEEYLDTGGPTWYKSYGLVNTNWVALN
jgi:hypothetical protein